MRQPGEPPQDDLLIRDDKNPNTAGAARFAPYDGAPSTTPPTCCWCGEKASISRKCRRGPNHSAGAWQRPENAQADVFIPISIQTERRGHYTNFQGTVSAFEPCFTKKTVAHAEKLFASPAEGNCMIQDLVIAVVCIGYAVAVLLTFGTVLTWVERKQAAIMSDRIGANRAYVRIPFTQHQVHLVGLFHGLADGLKMMLKEDFKPKSYDSVAYALAPWVCSRRCCWCSR